MTCVLAHRGNGEAALAAARPSVLPAFAVARLQGFFEIVAPRVGACPEGLTSAGLVRLDGLEGIESSPVNDDSSAATRDAKVRQVLRYLEALNELALADLEVYAEGRLRERWEVLAVGQRCGVALTADLAVATMLAYGGSGTLADVLTGYNRLAPHNPAPNGPPVRG